jgi:2'-5' RNA ligase
MAETIRTFIALELPRTVRAQIERTQEGLLHRGLEARWVKPVNIHLTLHFFGEIDPDRIEPIRAAMGEAAVCDPFRLEACGLGVFPGLRRARVIWSGVAGDVPALMHLQRRLVEALARDGFTIERRAFKAHLTLGRFKTSPDPKRLAEALDSLRAASPVPFQVSHLVLFESRLTPAGAIYSKRYEIPLEGGPKGKKPAPVDRRTR